MIELHRGQFEECRAIFAPLTQCLTAQAVLDGTCPGRVFADDTESPRTALIWDKWGRFYLAGDPSNADFNRAARAFFTDEAAPAAQERHQYTYELWYHPDAWADSVDEVLDWPVSDTRLYYVYEDPPPAGWRDAIPEGFALVHVDADLLNQTNLENHDAVEGQIAESGWFGELDFFARGWGYALVGEGVIASWCLVEYPHADRIDLGIGTDKRYQRRGFATITASACVERGVSEGLKVGWDCWQTNIGSRRTAEKVGFRLENEYAIYFGWFDPFRQLLANGWYLTYRAERPADAVPFFERAAAMRDFGAREHYNFACSLALAGNAGRALSELNAAVDAGFSDGDHLREDDDLENLHADPGWSALLARFQ